jgi:lipopolysaccharide export system protein LptA
MDASGATLEAERLDAFFTPGEQADSSQLDRAVADGHVTVIEPGRRAAGDHAEYFAAQGKVVMTGGPPILEDAENGFTTGQTLTFFTQGGSLTVDGGKGFRALSKHPISQ